MNSLARYHDRTHAGEMLARELQSFADDDLHVFALPRGGVPVGAGIARALHAPLDVLVVRKLAVPSRPAVAMGAVGPGGVLVLDHEVINASRVSPEVVTTVTGQEREELERQEEQYRGSHAPLSMADANVLLVDDNLLDGALMEAAVAAVREQHPARILAAVPVGTPEAVHKLGALVDEVICPLTPETMIAVELWYQDFTPPTDDEVRQCLDAARGELPAR